MKTETATKNQSIQNPRSEKITVAKPAKESTDPNTVTKIYTVVSMFSGCGGMDLGFRGGFNVFGKNYKKNPFRIVWANDVNEAACRTYRKNVDQHIRCGDIWEALETLPTSADILIGGFPCQDISVNGKGAGVYGKRSGLYKAMVEAIKRTKPKVFIAENVKGLLMKHNRESLEIVLRDFKSLGYDVSYQLYHAADYGVPQRRERVIIIGVAKGVGEFIPPQAERTKETWMTAQEAIADLEQMAENQEINHIWSKAEKSAEQGNRKLKAMMPAHTIRAECHGNIQFHYTLPRRISMREAARFQSFPDDFIFDAKLRECERQIGNAVPPVLAWHVAQAVVNALKKNSMTDCAVAASSMLSV
jgi:DNA (cytosine-5)-methyltransferase 1